MDTRTAILDRSTLQYRHLVSDKLWTRLVGRVMRKELVSREMAEAIIDSALGFLKLSADHPGNGFSPAKLVDLGWHTFLMYTRDYDEFCRRYAGRFIHHEPNDNPDSPQKSGGPRRTLSFMAEHSIAFNATMWNESENTDCDGGTGPPLNCTCT